VPVTLKQLSASLNLSQTTVSRALNGYPEVSEGTRRRVLEAAEKFRYRPNVRAQRLAAGRAMAIGHVIPMSASDEIVNVIFADFIAGAGEVYARHGYDMVLSTVRAEDEFETYRKIAESGGVDGVIVHSPLPDDPRLPLLHDLGIPFVVHGRASETATPYCWLDIDNKRAFERATAFLLDLGHRRIALINGAERMDFAQRRRAGYVSALAMVGIEPDPSLMHQSDMTEPYGYATARALLDSANPPTAFLGSSIVPALGIRRAVEEKGLRIGRDVSIICHDDQLSYLPNGGGEPIFTAMRSSVRAAGRRCAEMLIARLGCRDAPPVHELWEAELVIGHSTGPAKEQT
jgi:LacI family transcriptional regulator